MRCILYICRRTFGFHKEEDRISFSQFERGITRQGGEILDRGAGLSRSAISEALRNLSKSGAIFIEKNSKGNIYKINIDMDINKVVREVNQLRRRTSIGRVGLPKVVRLLNIQKKGKERETKIYASGSKEPSAHSKFIKFFHDTCLKVRNVKLIITGKDGQNLKRVLDYGCVQERELEQIALYFLSNRYYKKFAPSISTFLSAGIINGLADSLRNRPLFWKEMAEYEYKLGGKELKSLPVEVKSDLGDRLLQTKQALLGKMNLMVAPSEFDNQDDDEEGMAQELECLKARASFS